MAYGRSGVLTGEVIALRTVFLDGAGIPIDTDSLPVIYIYDSSVDNDVIDAEVEAETYDSALVGPLTSVKISTGYYEYSYTVPAGSDIGTWSDVWVGQINTVDVNTVLTFTVVEGGEFEVPNIGNNKMIIIELDATISNADNTATLETDQRFYFTTIYSPLYASPDLIRLEVGQWLNYIPDDTLALMIHWSSREADFIKGRSPKNASRYKFARTKFVVYDAAWRAINLPGYGLSATEYNSTGGKKQLGDLLIQGGGSGNGSGAISSTVMKWLFEQRQEWWMVVNSAATLNPGQTIGSTFTLPGVATADRRLTGRMWEEPDEYHYAQPGINSKNVSYDQNGRMRQKGRWGFRKI